MSTAFPGSLDSFINPTAANLLSTPAVLHTDQHSNLNDAVAAIETKLGVNNSAVTSSIDYLLKNPSSLDPGHTHSDASITGFIKSNGTTAISSGVSIPFAGGTSIVSSTILNGLSAGGSLVGVSFRDNNVEYASLGMTLGYFGLVAPAGVFFGANLTNYILLTGGGIGYIAAALGHAFTGAVISDSAITSQTAMFAATVSDVYSQFGVAADIFALQTNATDRLIVTKSEAATSGTIRSLTSVCEFTGTASNSSGFYNGVVGYAGTSSASTKNLTASTLGGGLVGVLGRVVHSGSGTVTQMSALSGVFSGAGAGAITDAFVFISPSAAVGTTTTPSRAGAIWIKDPSKGTLTYGIRIDSMGGTAMQIALGGTGANNGIYFGATTAVGTEKIYASAAFTLDVEGRNTVNFNINATTILAVSSNSVTFSDAKNVVFNATTGSKLGTATSQKIGIWNATPIVQPANTVAIDTTLVNIGLRATGGVANFATTLQPPAGTTAIAPLTFTSGTNLTTAVPGTLEYNGTNLFFTRTGTTRENVLVAVDNVSAPSTSVGVGIVNYYGAAATNFLGDPNRWLSVNVLGSVYKVPLYT